jgi:hypothetical protein
MKPIKDYEVFVKSVVIKKARIIRGRPLIREWCCPMEFVVDADTWGKETGEGGLIDVLLNNAGRVAGWGDYRPACKGDFGQYIVKEVE